MFCNVPPHEVVPLIDVDAEAREQARAPAEPAVKADEVKSTVLAPLGLNRCMITAGVPASDVMLISSSVAVSGTWQSLPCGPTSRSARVAPLSAPIVKLQPPFSVRVLCAHKAKGKSKKAKGKSLFFTFAFLLFTSFMGLER